MHSSKRAKTRARNLTLTESLLGWCGLFLIGLIGALADRRDRRRGFQARAMKQA